MDNNFFFESENTSNFTYDQIKSNGLSKITSELRTDNSINALMKYLIKKDEILDAGCGYGRLTIPITKRGFDISGIDLNKQLIIDAKNKMEKEKLQINFKQGSIINLPYENNSFDKIICMWLTFNHLVTKQDQLRCLNEFYRVLKPNGQVIIELTNGDLPSMKAQVAQFGEGEDTHVVPLHFHDVPFYYYIHTNETLSNILKKSNFDDYVIVNKDFAYESKLMAFLYK